MFKKTDIIKTYIFEPKYYEYKKLNMYCDCLIIFNNKYYIYLNIKIYDNCCCKIIQTKNNYVGYLFLNYYENKISLTKVKYYDNRKIIDLNYCGIIGYDFKITKNEIFKKIDKDIYIIYYHKTYFLKNINNNAIRHHKFINFNYFYEKKYITYYINYYIIIYNDIKRNNIKNKSRKCNTIFCNFSRNFMLFI